MTEKTEKTEITSNLKFDFTEKLNILKNIRHEIKKKRFILDENVDKFGFNELSQLTKVKNTSQIKGYPFVASKIKSKILKGVKIGLKVVPIETKFEKHEHPTNLEFITLKELTDNLIINQICPHITYFVGLQKVSNKSRAIKFLNLKRLEVEEQIKTHSNMLISEFVEGGSLDNWVYDIYEDDETIPDIQWKSLVFQIVYTLNILQKKYKMMHNDLHYGNILVDNTIKPGGYFVYEINNKKYYIPNHGIVLKLWDFEFVMIYSNKIENFYPNQFIIGKCEFDKKTFITKEPEPMDNSSYDSDDLNVPFNYNETYDLHYFLTSLLDLYISQELFDWIMAIYPSELIPKEDASTSETSSEISSDEIEGENCPKIKEIENDTESDIESEEESDDESGDESDVESDESSSSESSSRSAYDRYLSEGRIKNGMEKEFTDLPTPNTILDNDFFSVFLTKPVDFDEKTAIYFKAGF
jgi:hypothetical protein